MRILIVKASALGDIVHTFPAISYLKSKYPDAIIDWVVEGPCSSIVRAHPDIANVLILNTRMWRKLWHNKDTRKEIGAFYRNLRLYEYDILFDFQGNTKSGLVTLIARSKVKVGFGRKNISEWPNLLATNRKYTAPLDFNVLAENLHLVQSYFGDFSIPTMPLVLQASLHNQNTCELHELELFKSSQAQTPIIMICPGSNWVNKQLSEAILAEFLLLLQSYLNCTFVVIYGTKEEQIVAQSLKQHLLHCYVPGLLPLPLLQNFMQKMDLIISVDSLPLHLAGTTSVPTYSIFGPSAASKYMPLGHRHGSFQATCPYGVVFERRCPSLRTCKTGACLKSLSPLELFQAFKMWYSGIDSTISKT